MEKAKSIILEDEIQRFIDLGLGRGVDCTEPSPWLNKSSFLVRTATFNNVIGTDEGGFLQIYKCSVTSTCDMQVQMKASVSIPNTPVSLGLEGELSRSTNSSKKVVGKKAVNRTISFRLDQQLDVTDEPSVEDHSSSNKDQLPSFEETLSKWILKRISDRAGVKTEEKQPKSKAKGIDMLSDYLLAASKEDTALIVEDCTDFITYFGVTHYVSSITLGASEHTVMTESEYSKMLKQGSNVSVSPMASAQETSSITSKKSKSSTSSQMIGKIVDGKVERGSNNESVIGIKILPINSLLHKNRLLYLSMHRALMDYTEERTIMLTGPYLIECGDEQMYWKVDSKSGYKLTITTDIKHASVFHIFPCEETDDPYDFTIGWDGKTLEQVIEEDHVTTSNKSICPKIMRYLEVKTFFFGHFPGPLKLRSELSAKDSRLSLYKQLADNYFEAPADITPWLDGNKVYFISSANRKSLISISRCCTTKQHEGSETEYNYSTKCMDSQKLHDEKNIWMLFRLLRADTCADFCVEHCKTKKAPVEKHKEKLRDELAKLLDSSK